MTYGVAESMEAFPFFLPEQALFFAPAIVTGSLRSSGEFLRGHGAEMTSVLMQSLAEFLEDLYGFSIAGCGRFCAQVTNASSSRRLGITNITTVTRACGWTFLMFRTAERV